MLPRTEVESKQSPCMCVSRWHMSCMCRPLPAAREEQDQAFEQQLMAEMCDWGAPAENVLSLSIATRTTDMTRQEWEGVQAMLQHWCDEGMISSGVCGVEHGGINGMRHCQIMLKGKWSKKTRKFKEGHKPQSRAIVQENTRMLIEAAGIIGPDRRLHVGAVLHTPDQNRIWESLAG